MSLTKVQLLRTANLPKSLTELDRLVLFIHADAYQEELGKAILPGHELDRLTGVHSKSNERSRSRLVQAGALIRITKGYPGQASEYAVSEKWLQQYQVTDQLPKSRNRKQQPGDQEPDSYQQVARQLPTSNATAPDKLPDSYSILKDQETNKRKDKELVSNLQLKAKSAPTRINAERWQVVTGELSKDVLRCITRNSYSEHLLDQAINNGHKLSHLRQHFGRKKWDNAYDIGGLFISELRKLAGVPTPPKDGSLAWCGREGCDPVTRTWEEPSKRSDGSWTHNCLQCHYLEVRTTKAIESAPELMDFINTELKDFGKLD